MVKHMMVNFVRYFCEQVDVSTTPLTARTLLKAKNDLNTIIRAIFVNTPNQAVVKATSTDFFECFSILENTLSSKLSN